LPVRPSSCASSPASRKDAADAIATCDDEDKREQPEGIATRAACEQQRRRDRARAGDQRYSERKGSEICNLLARGAFGLAALLPHMLAKDHPRCHAEQENAAGNLEGRKPDPKLRQKPVSEQRGHDPNRGRNRRRAQRKRRFCAASRPWVMAIKAGASPIGSITSANVTNEEVM
jgi:hypothetical protein